MKAYEDEARALGWKRAIVWDDASYWFDQGTDPKVAARKDYAPEKIGKKNAEAALQSWLSRLGDSNATELRASLAELERVIELLDAAGLSDRADMQRGRLPDLRKRLADRETREKEKLTPSEARVLRKMGLSDD